MHTPSAPVSSARRVAMWHPPIQLVVIENDTGRRVCSFPSRLDTATATSHRQFEDEAWQRAVQQLRVSPLERHLYSVELR